jgi:hypothetical protein
MICSAKDKVTIVVQQLREYGRLVFLMSDRIVPYTIRKLQCFHTAAQTKSKGRQEIMIIMAVFRVIDKSDTLTFRD